MPMVTEPLTLGQRLRKLRDDAGLSQGELSARSGVSLSLITKIERGHTADPKASTLQALAKALGVTTSGLLGEDAS